LALGGYALFITARPKAEFSNQQNGEDRQQQQCQPLQPGSFIGHVCLSL
jgi:hypothetical protein